MYLRHTTRRKDGKVHRYWQLVRSVRVGRKVVQQTVAHLGELDAHGRARAKALARAITGEREQPELFVADDADDAIPVWLKRIRLERGRTFGDVWLGWTLWRALRLDEALTRGGARARPAVRALERVAHRRDLVPRHGARGPAGFARAAGQRRSAVSRPGSARDAQDGAARASRGAARGAVRPRLRLAALRR